MVKHKVIDEIEPVTIEWRPNTALLVIAKWSSPTTTIVPMTLREFFDRLGITEADCRQAFNAPPTPA